MREGRMIYDNLGLTLQRVGAMFIGVWIGAGISHDIPSVFWLTKFGLLLGFGLIAIAHFRAKTTTQRSLELRVKKVHGLSASTTGDRLSGNPSGLKRWMQP